MVLITVVPPLFVVKLVNAVVTPTAAPKVVMPAVFTAKVLAPLIVDTKPMLPEPVLAKIVFAPKVTASL